MLSRDAAAPPVGAAEVAAAVADVELPPLVVELDAEELEDTAASVGLRPPQGIARHDC